MKNTQIQFVHKAVSWIASLGVNADGSRGALIVRSERYDDDPGYGQNFVRSAFFEACEQLMLDPIDSDQAIHSGGFYCCDVKPEAIDDDEQERDAEAADSRYGEGCE